MDSAQLYKRAISRTVPSPQSHHIHQCHLSLTIEPQPRTTSTTTAMQTFTVYIVETSPDGSGNIHTLLGDPSKTTPANTNTDTNDRNSYIRKFQTRPETSPLFHSRTKVGVTPRASYPKEWDGLLAQVPARTLVLPIRSRAGAGAGSGVSVQGHCAESSCTPATRALGCSGEQMPATGATQWALEKAVPMLKAQELLEICCDS